MTYLVVDASVAVKWFVPEIHALEAGRIRDRGFTLLAPELLGLEVGNTLWKKVRRNELAPEDAAQRFESFARMRLRIVPSAARVREAFHLAANLGQTIYDCSYLALAIAQDCPLLTADRKFYAAVAASPLGRYIRWIEDEL